MNTVLPLVIDRSMPTTTTVHVPLPFTLSPAWDSEAIDRRALHVAIHALPTIEDWEEHAPTLLSQHNHVLIDAISHALVELGMQIASHNPDLTELTVQAVHASEVAVMQPYVQLCLDLVPLLRGLQCKGVMLRSLRSTMLYNTSCLSEGLSYWSSCLEKLVLRPLLHPKDPVNNATQYPYVTSLNRASYEKIKKNSS